MNFNSSGFRAELLAGNAATVQEPALNNRARSSDYLLRENDRINSCERLLDDQIRLVFVGVIKFSLELTGTFDCLGLT